MYYTQFKSFYSSIIIIGCFDSYTVHDQYTQGDGIIHVDTQKEKQCESLCNSNSLCQGFRHDTSDNSCELTVGNIAIFSGSSGSRFYQRHCPKGKTKICSLKYYIGLSLFGIKPSLVIHSYFLSMNKQAHKYFPFNSRLLPYCCYTPSLIMLNRFHAFYSIEHAIYM